MGKFAKPRVVVSKCLGFAPCRYNGEIVSDDSVSRLAEDVSFLPVCPEMEIGLGCPRDPIRIVVSGASGAWCSRRRAGTFPVRCAS